MAIIRGTPHDDPLFGGAADDLIIGYAGNDTLVGNGGDDTACGGSGSDLLRGNAGNDVLYDSWFEHSAGGALNLHNVLDGGTGNDTLITRTSVGLDLTAGDVTASVNEELRGGDGNDRLTSALTIGPDGDAFAAADVSVTEKLTGGSGDDWLRLDVTSKSLSYFSTSTFDLTLDGGDGKDHLALSFSGQVLGGLGDSDQLNAHLDGGAGDDDIRSDVGAFSDSVSLATVAATGGTGSDRIQLWTVSGGNDAALAENIVDGGSGSDRIDTVANVISGGAGGGARNTVDAGSGNDDVYAEARDSGALGADLAGARNIVSGGQGDDLLRLAAIGGDSLENVAHGGEGRDIITASVNATARADIVSSVYGDAGDDVLRTVIETDPNGAGNTISSLLDGGSGNDTVTGSGFADTVVGGTGADRVTGGGGNDVFVFGRDHGAAADVVTDFTDGSDHLDLGAFSLTPAGLQTLIAASSGDRLALSSIGGRDVILAGVDVHDLTAADFIL